MTTPNAPDGVDTPALLIDRAKLRTNIAAMAAAMHGAGVALRPHFKTSKMLEVARLQREAGAVGFTCATAAEVEALLGDGVTDIFWANSTATRAKARLAAEFNRDARVAIGLDSIELAGLLQDAAEEAGVVIPCLLEIDTGLHRTGVGAADAIELAERVAALDRLRIEGVYMHEGQLASLRGTRAELRAAGTDAGRELVEVAETLRAAGHRIDVVSVGSTPGWDSAPLAAGVTEARPGTYVFFDANQVRLGSADVDQCALTVLTTVVSAGGSDRAIIDAGIKAMSSDRSNRGDTFGLPLAQDGWLDDSLAFDGAYEEHGVVHGTGAARLRVGDTIRLLPNHACGVVNMWSRIYVIDDNEIVDVWTPVARH
jgi:D-serine deaminase-like pyridoxal phosphate-dependent protein